MQEEHREDSPDLRNQKLHINIVKREVDIEGEKIYLTTLEFNLLVYLTRHQTVFSHINKYMKQYGRNHISVKREHYDSYQPLEKENRDKAKGICRIENMRGVGYRMIIQNL